MKKKGFTLVELLAVIAILAILIIIALPNILKMYKEAKTKMFLQSIQNINKSAKDSYFSQSMEFIGLTETTYKYTDGEETVIGNIKVTYTGAKPKNGTLIIKPNGATSLAFYDDGVCAIKTWDSDEVSITSLSADECIIDSEPPLTAFQFDTTTGTIIQYTASFGTDVIIPSTIDGVAVTKIANNAFQNKGLTSVTLPEGIIEIGEYAFADNSLTTLVTPASIQTYGTGAFANNQLTSLTINHDSDFGCAILTIGNDAFRYNFLQQDNAILNDFLAHVSLGTNVLANNGATQNSTITFKAHSGVPEKC